MKKTNIVALILARGGSKGIPKKNLIKFCGKPLLRWSIEQALGAEHIKDVYVSSDSEEILNVSKAAKAKTIKRPKKLASDTSTSEGALIHAVNCINKEDSSMLGMIVYLQPTSPIRTSKDIDGAIEFFIDNKADSLFSGSILDDFCAWEYRGNKLRSLTYDYKKRGRRQNRQPYYLENGSMYIFKPSTLKRYKNRLGGKIVFYPMPLWKSYEIDKVEDVELCEYYMRKKILGGHNV